MTQEPQRRAEDAGFVGVRFAHPNLRFSPKANASLVFFRVLREPFASFASGCWVVRQRPDRAQPRASGTRVSNFARLTEKKLRTLRTLASWVNRRSASA